MILLIYGQVKVLVKVKCPLLLAWDCALFGLCNGFLNHLVDSLQLTQNALQEIQIKTFLKLTVHFFECLYDPYFVWRKRLKGLVQKKVQNTDLDKNYVFYHEL